MTLDGEFTRAPGAPELPAHTGRFVVQALSGFGFGYTAMQLFGTWIAPKLQSMTLVDSLTWPLLFLFGLALSDVMRGKTVIVVAHRLSTIAHLDRIFAFNHGRIVEDGRHDELLAQGGAYARLWERQSGGFLMSGARDATKPDPLCDPARERESMVYPKPQPDDEVLPVSRVVQ